MSRYPKPPALAGGVFTARGGLYVDLVAAPLKEHLHVRLYPDQTTAEAHVLLLASPSSTPDGTWSASVAVSHLVALHANAPLLWDGRRWTLVNLGHTMTTVLPEVGPPLQLDTRFFVHLGPACAFKQKPTVSPARKLAAASGT